MRRLSRGLRRLITAPIRWGRNIHHFMNDPLEDRSFGDAVADVAQDPSSIIPQVEALRRHLLRMILALIITGIVGLKLSDA